MRMSDMYRRLDSRLTAAGFGVTFKQPQPGMSGDVVHINVHTDTDVSSKVQVLTEVQQQIDLYADPAEHTPAELEDLVSKLRLAIKRAVPATVTVQTMMDMSTGRELFRALLLATITI